MEDKQSSYFDMGLIVDWLYNILEWLDRHSGSMIVILTFALVAITFGYVRKTSAMVDELKRQNDKNIEPDISIYSTPLYDFFGILEVTDGKIKLQVRNDGAVDVIDIKFITFYFKRWTIKFASGSQKVFWLPYEGKKLESDILKHAGGIWDIELDVKNWLKRPQEQDKQGETNFAFELSYRRQADLKRYTVEKKFNLSTEDVEGGRGFFMPIRD
ncbi:MAG: hypothetical protein JRI41_04480 [Deltaproteobacteria bacterium]|nr:hypothetical protein [Deltaproteobacteria bacterium]